MDGIEGPPLTTVRPGEGRVEDLGDGVGVAFKLWGVDTGGSIAMWKAGPVPARMIEIISPAW